MNQLLEETINVGILEDDPQMRKWLGRLLEENDQTQPIFSASNLAFATREVEQGAKPDVCLVDIELPDGTGTDFIKFLIETSNCKALILTVLGDKVSVMAGLDAGAHGYVLKDAPREQIIQAIRDVMKGENPMSAQASSHLLSAFKSIQPSKPDPIKNSPLTERETEILTLFAKGLSYNEAAGALHISTHTVREYVKSIYKKMSVHSRSEAVFEAFKLGWIKF